MSNEIYTRTGDNGTTALLDGRRVSKDNLRVESYGTIDEANSWIGAAQSFSQDAVLKQCLQFVQHRFYNCSSCLATPPDCNIAPTNVSKDDICWLEECIDYFQTVAGPITGFVLPGGCKAASLLHIARTVCRRAERLLVSLHEHEQVPINITHSLVQVDEPPEETQVGGVLSILTL